MPKKTLYLQKQFPQLFCKNFTDNNWAQTAIIGSEMCPNWLFVFVVFAVFVFLFFSDMLSFPSQQLSLASYQLSDLLHSLSLLLSLSSLLLLLLLLALLLFASILAILVFNRLRHLGLIRRGRGSDRSETEVFGEG